MSDVDTDIAPESSDESAPTAVAVLTHIVKSLVDDADSVTVEVDDSGRRLTLNVRVGEGELGRVIGRRGRTAASIRTVARAAASKDDVEIDIEFLDD
ncbi:MAG TPA: KH domain-containing protein [Ilumatobacteraceae bacterium]|nr:KH domain-containing protein [Ilumatobacteraceae bacterium]